MRPIGDYGLIFCQLEPVLRPVHVIADAVGHINKFCLLQSNHVRLGHVEACIVRSDHRVRGNVTLQFPRATDSAGNHRVGIHSPKRSHITHFGKTFGCTWTGSSRTRGRLNIRCAKMGGR